MESIVAVEQLFQRCAVDVADGAMEEAGADGAIGFDDSGGPRGVAARRLGGI